MRLEERRLREGQGLDAEEFLRQGGEVLGIGSEELGGRGKGPEVVRARELLTVLGVERYGLRVKHIAAVLGEYPQMATDWVMRGVRRRHRGPGEAACLEEIDAALSGPVPNEHWIPVPGTYCRTPSTY